MTAIDVVVRRATADDATSLELLERNARAAVADTRGGNRWLDEHPTVGDWTTACAHRIVFVAIIDGPEIHATPVGYLVADVDERSGHDTVLMIDRVYVEPEAREFGCGDALVAAAVAEGKRREAVLIEAHTLPGDRDIKNLYERAGITARLITVSKPLADL